MSHLVGNPEDRFSRVAAHMSYICSSLCASDLYILIPNLFFSPAELCKQTVEGEKTYLECF